MLHPYIYHLIRGFITLLLFKKILYPYVLSLSHKHITASLYSEEPYFITKVFISILNESACYKMLSIT